VNSSLEPVRVLVKAMRVPSGDQTGFVSLAGCVVRRVSAPSEMRAE
jgi:hypothetical protein